ncbi:unnamed protein product [Peniophora sp. CBMAI 1063]|nr:unnamed protein product [Peniophora sp. CBMAI 1063]
MTQTFIIPDGYFIGRKGKLLLKGTGQYVAYGVRGGRHGTRVVADHAAMVADTSGISGAAGRGFDSVAEAQEWCDRHILEVNPGRISELRVELERFQSELHGAQSRM